MRAWPDDPGFRHFHIDEDTIELYALDRIVDEGRLEAIEEHLLVCELCREVLRAEEEFLRLMREALRRL
jgi:hypothetical protein